MPKMPRTPENPGEKTAQIFDFPLVIRPTKPMHLRSPFLVSRTMEVLSSNSNILVTNGHLPKKQVRFCRDSSKLKTSALISCLSNSKNAEKATEYCPSTETVTNTSRRGHEETKKRVSFDFYGPSIRARIPTIQSEIEYWTRHQNNGVPRKYLSLIVDTTIAMGALSSRIIKSTPHRGSENEWQG